MAGNTVIIKPSENTAHCGRRELAPDIWVPLMMQPQFERGESFLGFPNYGLASRDGES
jgi:hypothetical protein